MGDKKLVKPNNGHVEIEIPYEFLIVDFSDLICARNLQFARESSFAIVMISS